MDYNKLIKALDCDGGGIRQDVDGCGNRRCKYCDVDGACNLVRMCSDASTAITALLERAEAAEARAEKAESERDEAVETIFKWTGCPECKYWDSATDWCKKHDRYATISDGCTNPKWRGTKEE